MASRLSKKHSDALAPFTAILAGVSEMLSASTDDELLELRDACAAVSTTNCWFMTYEAARLVSADVTRLIDGRNIPTEEPPHE